MIGAQGLQVIIGHSLLLDLETLQETLNKTPFPLSRIIFPIVVLHGNRSTFNQSHCCCIPTCNQGHRCYTPPSIRVIIVMFPSSIQAIVVVIDCNVQSKTIRPLLCMVFLGLRKFGWAIHLFAKPACKWGALSPTLHPYMLYVSM